MGSLAAALVEVTLMVGFNIYDMVIGLLGVGIKFIINMIQRMFQRR